MSQKRKRGLQRGLSEIVESQTAPPADRARQSTDLISKFKDPTPPPTTSYHLLPPPAKTETAPKKDFARVANSIARDALPAGFFKGTSKKLYDVLYQRTRGAIQPAREIKARHGDLMEWARMSHNTLRSNLRHLEQVGLVIRKWELGDNAGATYEVFIPEELNPSYHLLPPPTTSDQNLVGPSTQKLVGGGGGQVDEESTTYEPPKTFIKTIESDDDEAFAGMVARLKSVVREVTGKDTGPGDAPRWDEVAEVLAVELKIAAARTTVSSGPAFLAEHLRRRLWKKEPKQVEAEGQGTAPEEKRGVDSSKCPDCGGSGMYYPEGYEKGVARCRHAKLANPG